MTQLAFYEVHLTEELPQNTMILTQKGRWGYRGIGLVEVIWKMTIFIINTRLRVAVYLFDALYGFQQGRGIVTETLYSKLDQ